MDIRLAKSENDCYCASSIYASGWKAGYRGFFSEDFLNSIPVDRWVPYFLEDLETHRFRVAILSVNGIDLGAGAFGLSRDYPDQNWGEITSIYFMEQAWGKGYSQQLMSYMVDFLRTQGYEKIHLWALEENLRARKFYEKFGSKLSDNTKECSIQGYMKTEVEYII